MSGDVAGAAMGQQGAAEQSSGQQSSGQQGTVDAAAGQEAAGPQGAAEQAARQAISMPGLWAAPHRADMMVKPLTPIRNSRLRPNVSPSRPPVIRTRA